MIDIKKTSQQKGKFIGGHHLCAGCGAGIIARAAVNALSKKPLVVIVATGCLEVATTLIPKTNWLMPCLHLAFENAPAAASGVWAAYQKTKYKQKLPEDLQILVIAGDGASYDIGFQSLSGAAERNDNLIYLCYNNEAYMNTGVQRSSASPYCAETSTTPAGKKKNPKDLTKIMIAHNIEYAAQATAGDPIDLMNKIEKASNYSGVKFINALAPCTRGWGFDESKTVEIGILAAETGFWPIYEFEKGKYKINILKTKKIKEFLSMQKRYAHLFNPKENNQEIEKIQKMIDNNWRVLESQAK